MRREGYSLAYIDVMIDVLERKIEGRVVTSAVLAALQKRLDAISAAYREDPGFARYYPHMLELQTLIYGESGHEQEALQFLKEAVRQTGSARGLYSKLLKQYIVNHSRQVVAAAGPRQQVPAADNGGRRPKSRQFLTFNKMKVGVAMGFGLIAVTLVTLHFGPRAAALPLLLVKHSQITREKEQYDNLTAQYKTCSADLAQRQHVTDPDDPVAVDTYNKDAQRCQTVLKQLDQIAEQYNSLVGGAGSS
jgi:hypothetical protein